MQVYLNQNVFDAALERIRWIFDEFSTVIVNTSGGKDSTVVLNLALKVAEEKGRLPLKVLFVDQEAEWQTVIDHIRIVMADKRVDPLWLQVPIKLFNATSAREPWLYCWQEGAEWMREKEPNSIKVNRYGTDRFIELFSAYIDTEYPNEAACQLAGVRCEESPSRRLGLTGQQTYKWVTWGKQDNKKLDHYTFYPLYDWSLSDVWKAIHDNHWSYCRLYDYMYQYGIPLTMMRVSNVHHETALDKLFYLQEIEADTWDKLTKRISGINTAGKLGFEDYFASKQLPFMFDNWREYRDYLVENLIDDEELRARYATEFARMDKLSEGGHYYLKNDATLYKVHINTLLANDYHFTKLRNFNAANRRKV